jgi:hypothetical protein
MRWLNRLVLDVVVGIGLAALLLPALLRGGWVTSQWRGAIVLVVVIAVVAGLHRLISPPEAP